MVSARIGVKTERMSDFDRENLQDILEGMGEWYGAILLRCIAAGDSMTRNLFEISYPEEVRAIRNINLPYCDNKDRFDHLLNILYAKADSANKSRLRICFSRFE